MSHFDSILARFVQIASNPATQPTRQGIAGYLKSSNRGNVSRSTGCANGIGSDTRMIFPLGNRLPENRYQAPQAHQFLSVSKAERKTAFNFVPLGSPNERGM